MSKIQFTKSFTRDIVIDSKTFTIMQDYQKQELYIMHMGESMYMYLAKENEVYYFDEDFKLITRIFSQAHIDRYVVKM
jgi:tRNA A37 threonylcarbamoyladenosine biosynthesis protein TsaE